MNRRLTNLIRFVMDECLPPLLRDNRYFMYPFFYLAYRGKNLPEVMDFKSRVRDFTPEQYRAFYANLDSISRNRETDLNEDCIRFILGRLHSGVSSLIDVGCGGGYLLRRIHAEFPAISLTGSDIIPAQADSAYHYRCCDILELGDDTYDVVTCCHTLEHILALAPAVARLKTLARQSLIIVVPCQREFYYTLDEHVHFFTYQHQLYAEMQLTPDDVQFCGRLGGDWVVVVRGRDA